MATGSSNRFVTHSLHFEKRGKGSGAVRKWRLHSPQGPSCAASRTLCLCPRHPITCGPLSQTEETTSPPCFQTEKLFKALFFFPLNKKYLQDFLYFSRQFLIQKQAHVDQTVTGNGGRLLTYKTVTGTGRRLLTYKTHGQEKETEQEEHGDASATWPSVWDNHIHLETV